MWEPQSNLEEKVNLSILNDDFSSRTGLILPRSSRLFQKSVIHSVCYAYTIKTGLCQWNKIVMGFHNRNRITLLGKSAQHQHFPMTVQTMSFLQTDTLSLWKLLLGCIGKELLYIAIQKESLLSLIISLFNFKTTVSVTKSLHGDRGLCFLHTVHLPIYLFFSYTYTLLFCWNIKSCFDCCFPQQIIPQTSVQWYNITTILLWRLVSMYIINKCHTLPIVYNMLVKIY